MFHPRIKICGVTRPRDARIAADAGADAVGMVFHPPSRRHVDLDRARNIIDQLTPYITPVGVFVDAEVETIFHVATRLHLDHVQLNGAESPELIQRLKPLRIVKAVKVHPETFAHTLDTWRHAVRALDLEHLVGLVLEPSNTDLPGGSGVANDWTTVIAARTAGHWEGLPPLIAAGGLTPDTVNGIVRSVRPYAVDVSSGVESSVGVKDPHKIRAFVRAVRAADI